MCSCLLYRQQRQRGEKTTHLYFANVKVPVETLALKDINVDLGHSLKDFDSIRKKKKDCDRYNPALICLMPFKEKLHPFTSGQATESSKSEISFHSAKKKAWKILCEN